MYIPAQIRLANNNKITVNLAQTGSTLLYGIVVDDPDAKQAIVLAYREAWSAGLSALISAVSGNPSLGANEICRAFATGFIEALRNTNIDTVLRHYAASASRVEFNSIEQFLSSVDACRTVMAGGPSNYITATRGSMISNMFSMLRSIAACQTALGIRAYPKSRFVGTKSCTAFGNALIKSVKPISEWVSIAAENWNSSMGGHSLTEANTAEVIGRCSNAESIIRNPVGLAIEVAESNLGMALDLMSRYVDVMTDGDPAITALNGMTTVFSISHEVQSARVMTPSAAVLHELFGLNVRASRYMPDVVNNIDQYMPASLFDSVCVGTRYVSADGQIAHVSDSYKFGWNVGFVSRAWSSFANHLTYGLTPKERELPKAELIRKRLAPFGLTEDAVNEIVHCLDRDTPSASNLMEEFLAKNPDHNRCASCGNLFLRGFMYQPINTTPDPLPDTISIFGRLFNYNENRDMFAVTTAPPSGGNSTQAAGDVCTHCAAISDNTSASRRKYQMRDKFIGTVITLKLTNGEVDPEIKFHVATNAMYFGDREGSSANAVSRGVNDGCAKFNSIVRGIDDSVFMVTSHGLNPTVSCSEDQNITPMRINSNQILACDKSLTDDQIEACLVRLLGEPISTYNHAAAQGTDARYSTVRVINASGHAFGIFRDRRGRIAAFSILNQPSILVIHDRDEDPLMENLANRSRFFLVDGVYYANIDASPNAPSIYLSHDQRSERFLDRAVGIEFETGSGFRNSNTHKGEQFMEMMTSRGVSTQFASWAIKTDGSLCSGAVEIVSPPMKGHAIGEGIKAYYEVAKELRFAVENYAAGGHIHVESTDLFGVIQAAHSMCGGTNFNRETARILGFGMSAMLGTAREFVSRRRRNHHYCSGNPGVRYTSPLLDQIGISDGNAHFRDGIALAGGGDQNGRHGMEIQHRHSVQGGGSMGGTVRNARNYTLEFRIWPSSSSPMRVMARAELSQKLVEWFYQIIRPSFQEVATSGQTFSADDVSRMMSKIRELSDLLPGAAGRISGIERVRRRKVLVDRITTLLGLSDECSKVLRSIHMQFFSPTYNTNSDDVDRVPPGFNEEDPSMSSHNDTGVGIDTEGRGDVEAIYVDNIQ